MDPDDIAGVVTSAKGPEAGVWVIAETTELETKFRKIVVTDDQGRYLLPDLPSANYSIWTRGYGLVDSAKVRSKPGARLNLTAVVAPNAPRSRAVLSGELLVFADPCSAGERFSGHRATGQSDRSRDGDAGSLDQPDQGELRGLPSDRQRVHAQDPESAGNVRVERRGLGSSRQSGPGWAVDDECGGRAGSPAGAGDVCRLDRPDCGWRVAAGSSAPAGDRAEPGSDVLGLGRPFDVCARRAFDRQAQPHRQRKRRHLRCGLGQRCVPDRRSSTELHHGNGHSRTGSEGAARQAAVDAGSVTVLGR